MTEIANRRAAWLRIEKVLVTHYRNADILAARILCSVLASHALTQFLPAWCLAIAPPGSMKTDFLESFRDLPRVHFVDEVTPNTFLSGKVDQDGQKRKQPASLLHRIGKDGVLVVGDFSTFTSNPKTLGIILSQLRRIYDGHFSREFGTEQNMDERSWSGRLTLFAGATPDVDRHYSLFQSLGERFVRVRWPRAGGVETGVKAMQHTGKVATELRAAVRVLMAPILSKPQLAPTISAEMELKISNLSEFIALCRTHIERDPYKRDAMGIPVTEGNTRLPQQLCQTGRGSALLDGRSELNDDDFQLAGRAALDSVPPARIAVLRNIIHGKSPYSADLPKATVARAIEELELSHVVEKPKSATEKIVLSDTAIDLLNGAGFPELGGWSGPIPTPYLGVISGTSHRPASKPGQEFTRNESERLEIGVEEEHMKKLPEVSERRAIQRAESKETCGQAANLGDPRTYGLRSWDDDSDGALTIIRAARERYRNRQK